jgi:hypothetical protein
MKLRFVRAALYSLVCTIVTFGLFQGFQVTSKFANQRGKLKKIEEAFTINPQVRVTKVKVGSRERHFDEEFEEADDWPKRVSLEVENISTKPIIYLAVNLKFPETRSSGNLMMYPVKFGIMPTLAQSSHARPLRLMPGEKLEVALDTHYEDLEHFIGTRQPMNQIQRVQIEIGFIVFEDGIAWAGEFLRQDPNNPSRYLPVGQTRPN